MQLRHGVNLGKGFSTSTSARVPEVRFPAVHENSSVLKFEMPAPQLFLFWVEVYTRFFSVLNMQLSCTTTKTVTWWQLKWYHIQDAWYSFIDAKCRTWSHKSHPPEGDTKPPGGNNPWSLLLHSSISKQTAIKIDPGRVLVKTDPTFTTENFL